MYQFLAAWFMLSKPLYQCNVSVHRKKTNHFLAGFLAVHETFRNDIWREQLITLFEFLEEDAIGKALSANTNSFQHAITSQLIQHQWRVYFACLKHTTQTVYNTSPTN